MQSPLPFFVRLLLVALTACGGANSGAGDPIRRNVFGDPFGKAVSGMPGCPEPAGPLETEEEAAREAHWRAERGTSCFRSGRCRLPNAYRYDQELFPRAVQFVRLDGRFSDASIWLTVQRRWVIVQGCVRTEQQGLGLEAALRNIDDVESVIGQWSVGIAATPRYEVK